MSSPLALALEAALLGTPFQGRVEVHERLGSTIDACRERAEAGAPEGCVVLAESQDAGRGQPGHRWHSPPGAGVYVSVLLRPALRPEEAGILAPVAGLAACEALRGLAIPCRIKLPNDLVVPFHGRWRKLGGVLVDTAVQGGTLRHAVVSLGVNVTVGLEEFPPELRATAVSCAQVAPHPVSREAVAATFLRELAGLVEEMGSPGGRDAIRSRHELQVRDVLPGAPAPEED